jgi:uncharacterized protein YbjT (DUF2867 family)
MNQDQDSQKRYKILLTGANGYIGKRLLPVLVAQSHHIYCLVRDKNRFVIHENFAGFVEVVEADLHSPESLAKLPHDFDVAYYLVHSMVSSTEDYYDMEQEAATNFVRFIDTTQCQQIIYLGAMSSMKNISKHMQSRLNVQRVLSTSKAALTTLGAGIIVGSGSASFEIIRDIVEKLPVMVAPRWLNTRSQPISIRNAIKALSGVMLNEKCYKQHYDIAGPDILTYKEMMQQYAEVRGYKRLIITVPVLTPRISAYWLSMLTSTHYNLAYTLVRSMSTEVISSDNRLNEMLGIEPIPYKTAIKMAFDRIEQHLVLSSWRDAMVSSRKDIKIMNFFEVPTYGCYKDVKEVEIQLKADEVVENFMSIGGENGWYYADWLWRIRGFIDSMLGGVGLRRGRTNPDKIESGDALDFWRVIAFNHDTKRLLLFAEMKLPGEAWLEFKIIEKDGKHYLRQTATFRPRGIWGRIYWYASLPFHLFIFRGMAGEVAGRKNTPIQ